jgi:hypothetical protein
MQLFDWLIGGIFTIGAGIAYYGLRAQVMRHREDRRQLRASARRALTGQTTGSE